VILAVKFPSATCNGFGSPLSVDMFRRLLRPEPGLVRLMRIRRQNEVVTQAKSDIDAAPQGRTAQLAFWLTASAAAGRILLSSLAAGLKGGGLRDGHREIIYGSERLNKQF